MSQQYSKIVNICVIPAVTQGGDVQGGRFNMMGLKSYISFLKQKKKTLPKH